MEIEAHILYAVARRAGVSSVIFGHFTTGGAEADFTALLCALTRSQPEFSTPGARAFPGAPIFYVSAESYPAWFKIAHQAGIERSAVCLVDTDGTGRIDPEALANAIAVDSVNGKFPVMMLQLRVRPTPA